MPKLLAYLPCEKVVVEERLGALDPRDRDGHARARCARALAQRLHRHGVGHLHPLAKGPGESGQTPVASIDFEKAARQQFINRLARFPIWTPGTCQLKLMVKSARDPEFRPLASVLIMLRHSRS